MTRLQFPLVFLLTLPLLVIQPGGGGAPSVQMVVPAAGGGASLSRVGSVAEQLASTQLETDPTSAAEIQAMTTHDRGADSAAAGVGDVVPPILAPAAPVATRSNAAMVPIPAGSFVPLFLQKGEAETRVGAFQIDRQPVTRGEFLEFVEANPRWRRSQVKPIFTEERYLANWRGDLDVGDDADANRPVTQVSWFAAKAYCEAQGARLPTVDEWEYVAAASEDQRDATRDPAFLQWLLELYTRGHTGPLPQVGTGVRNAYGIDDLHGPVREWVLDFNTVLVSDDSRGVGARDHKLYCAGGAIGATRTDDYAAFLRYTFRSGLNGRSTIDNLGFRCAGGR